MDFIGFNLRGEPPSLQPAYSGAHPGRCCVRSKTPNALRTLLNLSFCIFFVSVFPVFLAKFTLTLQIFSLNEEAKMLESMIKMEKQSHAPIPCRIPVTRVEGWPHWRRLDEAWGRWWGWPLSPPKPFRRGWQERVLGKDGDRKDYGMYTKGWILNWGECRMRSGCFHVRGPCREHWVRSQGSRQPQRALGAGSRTNPVSETHGACSGQPPTQHLTHKQHPCLSLLKSSSAWEFLAGPVVRIRLFHGRDPGSVPDQENWDPASCAVRPKKKNSAQREGEVRAVSK